MSEKLVRLKMFDDDFRLFQSKARQMTELMHELSAISQRIESCLQYMEGEE